MKKIDMVLKIMTLDGIDIHNISDSAVKVFEEYKAEYMPCRHSEIDDILKGKLESKKWADGAANISAHMKKEKLEKQIVEAEKELERAKVVLAKVRKERADFLEGL